MSFTHRPMQTADMENCFAILQDRFLYNDSLKKRLFALWTYLLKNESCVTVVVEDRRLPRRKRHVAFGLSLFVMDAFAWEAKTSLPPFMPLQILELFEKGQRPFLIKKEIAAANAKGDLNLLTLHYGWDEKRLSPEDTVKARHLLKDLFIPYHGGYRFKEFLEEVYGPDILNFLLVGGNSLRRDYKEFAGSGFLKGVPSQSHPYLVGFTPQEAVKREGTQISTIHARSFAPRFHFLPGQTEILERALRGETDEAIAESLGISPWTIKKRWQSIYGKVLQKDPELLTEDLVAARKAKSPVSVNRLKQRRRYLMDYLRSHPEEIMPSVLPSGPVRKK